MEKAMKKVLVTGAKGFVGKNLIAEIRAQNLAEVYEYDLETPKEQLKQFCRDCDFVFHLAGVNRPQKEAEFMEGNAGFTEELLSVLQSQSSRAPILASSSIQALFDHPYGKSKRAEEALLAKYSEATGIKTYVFRLSNLFGKWCRPNYNSVVATFCHKIARDEKIAVHDSETVVPLVYIDDVVHTFLNAMAGGTVPEKDGFYTVTPIYPIRLAELAERIYSFRASRVSLAVPNMGDELTKKLYATYLSYLPEDRFSYPLTMHQDVRGSFTEFLRLEGHGQVSVNVAKPGVVKGNHWHHTKNEKFLVVSGRAVIRFRKPFEEEVFEYHVSGEHLEVVDIPAGYTHHIENVGDKDLVTVMWANEPFDPNEPDTFSLKV